MAKRTDQPESGGEVVTSVPAGQVVTPEQKKTLLQRAEAGERLNVGELALVTGNVKQFANLPKITTVNTATGASEVDHTATGFSPEHAAAASLHGWSHHRHHENAPMVMSLSDYQAALKAAAAPPKGYLTPVPHLAAFSRHAPPIQLVTTRLTKERFPKAS